LSVEIFSIIAYEQVSRLKVQLLYTCPLGKPYHVPIHKTSKNKQKTEYMIVGSRQWLCNMIDDRKIELHGSAYTGCPKKNYTLFDFMYRKTYYSYFTKIKSIVFTKD
jgi:hypothetical protein